MIRPRVPIGNNAVAAHYDELDHFYREVWGEHVHHGLWLRGDETPEEAVLLLVDLVGREILLPKVCDIGCGYGATARRLAERGAKVTGITISPVQFAIAQQQQTSSSPQLLLGDWLNNQLPAESFDSAIAVESSEHMPDIRAFFYQAHRVLRPEGRLVVCAWLAAEEAGAWARRRLLEPICREGRMPNLGTADDYRSLGEEAGLALARFQDVTAAAAPTWPAIVRRLLGKLITTPIFLRFLSNRQAQNRIFAVTILRIWLAYRVGVLRYGIFTFVKS